MIRAFTPITDREYADFYETSDLLIFEKYNTEQYFRHLHKLFSKYPNEIQ